MRRSLGLLLLFQGHAVQAFASGEAVLVGVDLQLSGCAILDLRLGGISRLQVLRHAVQRAECRAGQDGGVQVTH